MAMTSFIDVCVRRSTTALTYVFCVCYFSVFSHFLVPLVYSVYCLPWPPSLITQERTCHCENIEVLLVCEDRITNTNCIMNPGNGGTQQFF